jgi:hypothetical protein
MGRDRRDRLSALVRVHLTAVEDPQVADVRAEFGMIIRPIAQEDKEAETRTVTELGRLGDPK